ncbi:hypothetical protein [Halocatena marina]|uniref:hypothetical protein n=1 Tax=Halocatena marina TaxID=2934937 RepID=UPI00200BBB48|nr:hypothetical protein [Halocatena marina]
MTRTKSLLGISIIVSISLFVLSSQYESVLIFLGAILPNIDKKVDGLHRSWIFHTTLSTTFLYHILKVSNLSTIVPQLVTGIHYLTIGIILHMIVDFGLKDEMEGSGTQWPINPSLGSEAWGLIFLGISWGIQWFFYLSSVFIPWIAELFI